MFSKNRFFILLGVFTIVIGVLLYRVINLTVGEDNIEKSDLVLMSRGDNSLYFLEQQVVDLNKMISNIQNYSLGDIKKSVSRTVFLAREASLDINAQREAWMDIKGRMNIDKKSYTQLKENLDQVRSMQKNQILRLKSMLDKARKPSVISDAKNLFLTFILGVLSSFIASIVWSRYKEGNSSE